MSFVFGGVRGREDPELAAANRRSRRHLARDINDERALAGDDRPPVRRGNHWLWLAAAVVVLGVLALASGRGGQDVPVSPSCTTPAIAVQSSAVTAGSALRYRLTGPDGVRYVVTLDGVPVSGDAGSLVGYTQTPAGPALRLEQCLSPTLLLAAPAGDGPHELALLRLADDGTPTEATAVTVTVSGTR